jgi:hypothetical protein
MGASLKHMIPSSSFDVKVHLIVHIVRDTNELWQYVSAQHLSSQAIHGNTQSQLWKRGWPETNIVEGSTSEEVVDNPQVQGITVVKLHRYLSVVPTRNWR